MAPEERLVPGGLALRGRGRPPCPESDNERHRRGRADGGFQDAEGLPRQDEREGKERARGDSAADTERFEPGSGGFDRLSENEIAGQREGGGDQDREAGLGQPQAQGASSPNQIT